MHNDNEDFNFQEANESPCPHCEIKFSQMDEFLHKFFEFNKNETSTIDDLIGLVDDFYDSVYEEAERQTYEKIGDFAYNMAYGDDEED